MKQPGTDVDLYVAGFPCQTFSCAGQLAGICDSKGRGTVIFKIAEYLDKQHPKGFILENVKNLVTAFPRSFTAIISMLRALKGPGGVPLYEIHWKILHTNVEGALPQHRQRVYIVGLLRSSMIRPFSWPGRARHTKTLSEVLDTDVSPFGEAAYGLNHTKLNNVVRAWDKCCHKGENPMAEEYIVDIGGSKMQMKKNEAPCLTSARASQEAFWSTKRNRELRMSEMGRLQGVEIDLAFPNWRCLISPRQMGFIIGNAMTVTLMQRVTRRVLLSMGREVRPDPFD